MHVSFNPDRDTNIVVSNPRDLFQKQIYLDDHYYKSIKKNSFKLGLVVSKQNTYNQRLFFVGTLDEYIR